MLDFFPDPANSFESHFDVLMHHLHSLIEGSNKKLHWAKNVRVVKKFGLYSFPDTVSHFQWLAFHQACTTGTRGIIGGKVSGTGWLGCQSFTIEIFAIIPVIWIWGKPRPIWWILNYEMGKKNFDDALYDIANTWYRRVYKTKSRYRKPPSIYQLPLALPTHCWSWWGILWLLNLKLFTN